MYAYEVWNSVPQDLTHEILETAYVQEKRLYRQLVSEMAANLRKREQFLLKMPRAERHALFQPLLGLPNFEILGQNLFITWLGTTQEAMMVAFLDQLGIKHDGHGYAEGFPENVEADKLKKAVEALYAAFPEAKVNVYLGVMERVSGVSWPALAPLLKIKPAESTKI